MANFDYDVLIIESSFSWSVAALRAAEKGFRVAVVEASKCWKIDVAPKSNWDLKDFVWFPAADMYGVQRAEYLGVGSVRYWPA